MRWMMLIIFFAIILSGCLPDPLPVGKIDQLKPQIVVSSQILPNESLVVLLTKSFGALDASDDSDLEELINQIAINDATVVVSGDEFTDTLQFIQSGLYGGISIPFQEDKVYTLFVSSVSMGEVRATTQAKTIIPFETVSAKIYDTGFDTLAQIDFSFQDYFGKDFYMINVQHVTSTNVESEDFINPSIFTYLLQDNVTNDSQIITDSFKAFFRRDFIPGDTVMVQLANIDKGYYDFLKIRKDGRFNFSDFLGEPINYPSNVEGGLGWFTLHEPDIRFLVVEE